MAQPLTPEAILTLRHRLRLNQTAFAARLNEQLPGLRVNQVTVARWETGKHVPSGVAAAALERLQATAGSSSS